MHKEFLDKLSDVASVQLVAKLKDESIELPFQGVIRVFIPDLHMFSKERQKDFKYECHTNYNTDENDLLPQLARFLLQFKTENNDKNVLVYQMGDCLDPWRETPKPWELHEDEWQGIIQRMIESNEATWDPLVDDSLHTNFLLGNHDYDLHRLQTFYDRWRYLRFYLNNVKGIPVAGMFHGDIFSWAERLPDWIQQFFVYHFSPKEKSKKFNRELDKAIRDTHKRGDKYIDYENYNDTGTLFQLGQLVNPSDVESDDEWNIKRKGEASKSQLQRLGQAKKLFAKVNKKTGYRLRMAIIGHTHCARIAVDDEGDDSERFILVDCGAWVKKCSAKVKKDGNWEDTVVTNAQIGVLSTNEVRIYQLSPKA
jgi:UDP-2,3-diacylglucosamine pyrophosphatase LpxH